MVKLLLKDVSIRNVVNIMLNIIFHILIHMILVLSKIGDIFWVLIEIFILGAIFYYRQIIGQLAMDFPG